MDIAQRVFPCFDQPDLKAPITLTVTAAADWTVLANGRADRARPAEWRSRHHAADPDVPVRRLRRPVALGDLGARRPAVRLARPRSLAAQLDRDADELRRITEACFDHYAEMFDEPYPFDSYDQVFVPGPNWGALETPAA